MFQAQIGQAQSAQIGARLGQQRRDAFDRVHFDRQLRQHRRLVAATGADLQHLAQLAPGAQRLDHQGDHIGLGNSLRKAYRQRIVVVSAACQRLLHEQVARYDTQCRKHALVGNPFLAQPLDHARAGALRGHAYALRRRLEAAVHSFIQSRRSGIWFGCVRSTCNGVTDTRFAATAWKSVPSPASCALPAGPIQ